MGTLLFPQDHNAQPPPPQQQQQIWGSRLSQLGSSNSSHSRTRLWQASTSAATSSSDNTADDAPVQDSAQDDIFDQMIADSSYDPPSKATSQHELSFDQAPETKPFSAQDSTSAPHGDLSVDILQGRLNSSAATAISSDRISNMEPLSAAPSSFSSRRGSIDSSPMQRDGEHDDTGADSVQATRERSSSSAATPNKSLQSVPLRSFGGSAQNAITDAEIDFSTHAVVRPPAAELKDLQIHVHGIQMQGHKSRVETQIRMRIELVRLNTALQSTTGSKKFERIGSFTHLKLPPTSGTKRNSKRYQRNDIDPQKVLFFDATVVNATPPHDRIFVCAGCMQRERKRLHRKKRDMSNANSAVPAMLDGESVGNVVPPNAEEMQNMGFDPNLPGAQEQALQQMLKEDRKRVVVFNCGDYVDFPDGETILPTRITCYCRHHKAKVGFCIIFTMRDWQGRLLATGSTPPIMITDDHKTQGAAAARAHNGLPGTLSTAPSPNASSGARPGHSRIGSADSGEDDDQQHSPGSARSGQLRNSVAGVVKGVQKKAKKERKKPYDDGGARRRANTSGSSGLAMTARTDGLSTTSPADSHATSPSNQDSSSISAPTPQHVVGQSPTNMVQNMDAGSLSPSTLLTNPQSLPDFNLDFFLQQQGLQLNASTGLPSSFNWPQTAGVGQTLENPGIVGSQFPAPLPMAPMDQSGDVAMAATQPMVQSQNLFNMLGPLRTQPTAIADPSVGPQISKLIPGEGPTSGGIEVTILGSNFEEGITCVFGDVPATNTKVWAANTLVCILPPSQSPGPVVVTLKSSPFAPALPAFQGLPDRPLPLFTYIEASDRALMELALQVVGLQMTGAVQSARDVAMRVVGSNSTFAAGGGQTQFSGSAGGGTQMGTSHAGAPRDAVGGFISSLARARDNTTHSSFQDSVFSFLSLLDVDPDSVPGSNTRKDAIRLANKQGHTLLHLAVMLGFHRLAADLLRRGVPVNARDRNGYTALHFAALHGRVTIARLLLNGGARDNIPNWEGHLPIDIAREKDQIDVEMLLADTGSPAAQVHLSASHHDSGVSISEENSSDQGLDDLDESEEQSLLSDAEGSSVEDDSVLLADDEREVSTTSLVGPTVETDLDDASEAESADSASTAQRARARDPAFALRQLLSRAGDSVAAMEWAQRLHVPGTMDALQARLSMLQFNIPSLPASWSLGRPVAARDSEAGLQPDFESTPGPSGEVNPHSHSQDTSGSRSNVVRSASNLSEWANSLFTAPPPTYEDALANEDHKLAVSLSDADEKVAVRCAQDRGEGPSTQTKASAASDGAIHAEEASADVAEEESEGEIFSDEPQRSSHSRNSSRSSKLLPQPDPFRASSPARASKSSSTGSGFTHSMKRRAVALTHRRPKRSIYDDAMLLWFWIPALVAVIVLVFLSNGDGVLSFRDLLSYFDLGGTGAEIFTGAAQEATTSAAPAAVVAS
ncbi:SPT3 Dosage dependent suppressor of Ty-induced promoter mutations-like protein [Tilletia horrida]|uniref:SPT3 Dosage dependent suppressor of Ty-induced promoter mutations-like protein n=1 Tax=Tilletia horrida TaxID=155126 RepID=A0AAN6GPJ8_9BASI|nr:SPT3 Dosage dependent suppressor of Ty-induced promoter mutations-like protein [Tilletia horrida]KAK0563029.1 SPT3 Dosage dependent suppressor of Ty-induced promoter mutations-like protein [Tilletia horrida]